MSQSYRFDRVEVRPAERALLIDGARAELGSRAFDVLQALIKHRDRVVTKDELLDMVWPGLVVEENNLQAQVSALRKLLGPKAIATIPGRGYQFVLRATAVAEVPTDANLTVVSPGSGAGESPGAQAAHATAVVEMPILTHSERAAVLGEHRRPALEEGEVPTDSALIVDARSNVGEFASRRQAFLQRKGIAAFGAVAAIALVVGGVYWNTGQKAQEVGKPPTDVADAGAAKIHGLSIVVLPFVNLTGDANQEYLADGLTASMTADLTRIREASIVDARTAFSYKSKTVTAQQVGRELGVRFVLQGSVQRNGSTIRINAQLANAASSAQLWSESFEGDQSNLFALFDQVTGRLGKSIGEQIFIVAGRESETRRSDPKATDLIIRAQAEYIKPISLKNWQRGDAFYRKALALEPDNARAKLGVAMSTNMLVGNFPSLFAERTRQKLMSEARDFALDVKQIDPDDFRIYAVLGWLALETADFDAARLAYEKMVSLDPRDSTAIISLANFHFYAGEPERTIELTRKAMLSPDVGKYSSDSFSQYLLCCSHFMLGDFDSAIASCKKSIAFHANWAPPRAYLALAYSKKGDDASAATAVAEMRKLPPGDHLDNIFERPKPNQPLAYRDWYEQHFLPTAKKVGLWEKAH